MIRFLTPRPYAPPPRQAHTVIGALPKAQRKRIASVRRRRNRAAWKAARPKSVRRTREISALFARVYGSELMLPSFADTMGKALVRNANAPRIPYLGDR